MTLIDEDKISHPSLDLTVPPVLHSLNTYTETTFKDIESLTIHNIPNSECITERSIELDSLYHVNLTDHQTFISVQHDSITGALIGFSEECVSKGSDQSSKHSLSLDRRPCPQSNDFFGNLSNRPFLPGGFTVSEKSIILEEDFLTELLTTPPNFIKNHEFEKTNLDWLLNDQLDLLQAYDNATVKDLSEPVEEEKVEEKQEEQKVPDVVVKLEHRLEKPFNQPLMNKEEGNYEYVVVVDLMKPIHNFHQLVNPVIIYPFKLDTFQKQAILQLEAKQNVFVAAHTSAGKTVVAEYAIALALNHMTKVIYTSPIKALSNQKFREFKLKFTDVGLVTGDIRLNADAPVLIMTTEILRSMLYNGSDMIRDLEWVIFDEVHYINDPERGVVWEEVLILLPESVKIVLLSATVPNYKEFAEWVGRIKKRRVYVISTPKRPVPLEHFLYTGNSSSTCDEFFLLLDSNGNFQMNGYNKAIEKKTQRLNTALQQYGSRKPSYAVKSKQELQVWCSLIKHLDKTNRTPAVAFMFSKKRIDSTASNLTNLTLLDSKQKSSVLTFIKKSLRLLKPADQKLPQVLMLQDLLQRGIGIHHSGILPILKEIVEMLFQRGLVKILFATETFAMGVNMPAKTVIFDSIEKHDGEKLRNLAPGEYIQMAGRAGRRGLDKTGTVIILCKNEVPEVSDLHKMTLGQPTLLTSKFRVTYLMVLNLLRVEELRAEDVMKRSFGEFLELKQSTIKKTKLKQLKEKYEKVISEQKETETTTDVFYDTTQLASYYDLIKKHHELITQLRSTTYSRMNHSKILTPGRVVVLKSVDLMNDVAGVVLASRAKVLSIFVICDDSSNARSVQTQPTQGISLRPSIDLQVCRVSERALGRVVEVKHEGLLVVCTKVLKVWAADIFDDISRRKMMKYSKDPPSAPTQLLTRELRRLLQEGCLTELKFDLTDPISFEAHKELKQVKTLILQSPLSLIKNASFEQQFSKYAQKKTMEDEIVRESKLLKEDYLTIFPEYSQRLQVLKQLNFVDKNDTVRLKGRVACEINVQELLVTEFIFHNTFGSLSIPTIASLLSCLVFQQSRTSPPNLSPTLKQAKELLIRMARHVTEVQRQHGIMVDNLEEQCNFGLMEVIHEWASGVPFSKLVELTDVQEGVIVKCIQRLDILFQNLIKVARVIGDPVLGKRMEDGSRLIRRDIVFAASLYLQ